MNHPVIVKAGARFSVDALPFTAVPYQLSYAIVEIDHVNYPLSVIDIHEMIEMWSKFDEDQIRIAHLMPMPSASNLSYGILRAVPQYIAVDLNGVVYVFPASISDVTIDLHFEEGQSHGGHRSSNSQARGHAGSSSGAAHSRAGTHTTVHAIAIGSWPGQSTGKGSGLTGAMQAFQAYLKSPAALASFAGAPPAMMQGLLASPPSSFVIAPRSTGKSSAAKAVQDAGLKVGEISAWRVWRVSRDMTLHSGAMTATVWRPGEPMVGDPTKMNNFGTPTGVYAHKEVGRHLAETIEDYRPNGRLDFNIRRDLESNGLTEPEQWEQIFRMNGTHHPLQLSGYFIGLALGRVSLYGTVIEHEHGYRAQYAMIDEIVSVEHLIAGLSPDHVLGRLRQRYRVDRNSPPQKDPP